jgi:hypothetical protein
MISKQSLVDAYAEWLENWTWDLFATLTHPGYPSRTVVERKGKRWISDVGEEYGTPSFRYVMVLESGAYGDNNHLHILIGGLKRKARRFPWPIKHRWEEMAGHATITRFDPEQGGIRYLLKTLLPDRDFEITLSFNERRIKGIAP